MEERLTLPQKQQPVAAPAPRWPCRRLPSQTLSLRKLLPEGARRHWSSSLLGCTPRCWCARSTRRRGAQTGRHCPPETTRAMEGGSGVGSCRGGGAAIAMQASVLCDMEPIPGHPPLDTSASSPCRRGCPGSCPKRSSQSWWPCSKRQGRSRQAGGGHPELHHPCTLCIYSTARGAAHSTHLSLRPLHRGCRAKQPTDLIPTCRVPFSTRYS